MIAIDQCSDDVLAKGALDYTTIAKEAQAIANLANTAEQIVELIPTEGDAAMFLANSRYAKVGDRANDRRRARRPSRSNCAGSRPPPASRTVVQSGDRLDLVADARTGTRRSSGTSPTPTRRSTAARSSKPSATRSTVPRS